MPMKGKVIPMKKRRGVDPDAGFDPIFAAEMAAIEEARHEAWLEEHADFYKRWPEAEARPIQPIHVSRLR